MELRAERLDLRHQLIDQALRGAVGNARNVVDRLLRIELGALAADLVENVDNVRLHIEQAQFEHGEEPAGPGSDDEHVGLDRFGHTSSASPHAPPRRWDGFASASAKSLAGAPEPGKVPDRKRTGHRRIRGSARAVCSGGGAGGKGGFRTTIMPCAQWLPGRARANLVL